MSTDFMWDGEYLVLGGLTVARVEADDGMKGEILKALNGGKRETQIPRPIGDWGLLKSTYVGSFRRS